MEFEIIMPVDKSVKFRWPLPSAMAQLEFASSSGHKFKFDFYIAF